MGSLRRRRSRNAGRLLLVVGMLDLEEAAAEVGPELVVSEEVVTGPIPQRGMPTSSVSHEHRGDVFDQALRPALQQSAAREVEHLRDEVRGLASAP